MHLLDRVKSIIQSYRLLDASDKVVVAVSGGSDSLALLHILSSIELQLNVVAVYVDHGLRPMEIPEEQKTISESCQALNIPFIIRRIDVKGRVLQTKESLEDAARILRYRTLENYLAECDAKCIAVGHTSDDQVEEFFIRLLRGSSRRALSGMRLKRDHIIRPLLFEKKTSLVDFLSERGVHWCLDSSNHDRQFLRNRIRLDLLPLLEEQFNPAIRKTILQSMDLVEKEDHLLHLLSDSAYGQCVEFKQTSSVDCNGPQLQVMREAFLENHPAIQRRIMEKCCWKMRIRPTYDQICRLIENIEKGKAGSELHLKDGVRAEQKTGKMSFSRPLPHGIIRGSKKHAIPINILITGPGTYICYGINRELVLQELARNAADPIPDGEIWVDLEKISFPLLLRSALPGERFFPCGSPGNKKISRYFNDRKIPASERPAWPVLLCGDKVVALPGLQLDHSFRLTQTSTRVLTIRYRECNQNQL